MNIYVCDKNKKEFLEKLKEIQIVDDYYLDRSRFGKAKIKVESKYNDYDKINLLMPYLPENSLIVDQTEYPGKEYLLVVGEVSFFDFDKIKNSSISFSILTKQRQGIRFNGWIKIEELEKYYHKPYINNLTSINGKINNETYFLFETKFIEDVSELLHHYSDGIIIKNNEIYVKLLLQEFIEVYKKIKAKIEKIDIIDEDYIL